MKTQSDTLLLYAPDSAETISEDTAFFSTTVPVRAEPFREASPETVFGSATQWRAAVPTDSPQEKADPQQLNGLLLDGLTIVLFVLYFTLLFRHRSSIGVLLRALTVRGQFGQLIDEQSVAFRQFIGSARATGFLALLIVLFKGCLVWIAAAPALRIPEAYLPFLPLLPAGALLVVGCYKRIVTGTIAVLSGRENRIDSLRTFDRIYFVVASLAFTPIVLLAALADPTHERILFVLCFILLILLLLYYIIKNISFFLSRNLSILQWMLYLCAVEILPVSFFVLFIRRGFEW